MSKGIPVLPSDLYSVHSEKYHGESFLCDYLNVWILWLYAFVWSPVQLKSAWTDSRKITEHFGTKYGWIEDACGKNHHLKLGPLGCPLGLYNAFNFKHMTQPRYVALFDSEKIRLAGSILPRLSLAQDKRQDLGLGSETAMIRGMQYL